MEEQAKYGASSVASSPEVFKVGDRVEVIDAPMVFFPNIGKKGIISSFDKDGNAYIRCDDYGTITAPTKYLQKLPDTIRFDGGENPMEKQVGGEHYKMPIQPVEFIERNGLGFCVGNCIKYLCRYKKKNGREDLEKAKHYIDLLIQMEYPDDV